MDTCYFITYMYVHHHYMYVLKHDINLFVQCKEILSFHCGVYDRQEHVGLFKSYENWRNYEMIKNKRMLSFAESYYYCSLM